LLARRRSPAGASMMPRTSTLSTAAPQNGSMYSEHVEWLRGLRAQQSQAQGPAWQAPAAAGVAREDLGPFGRQPQCRSASEQPVGYSSRSFDLAAELGTGQHGLSHGIASSLVGPEDEYEEEHVYRCMPHSATSSCVPFPPLLRRQHGMLNLHWGIGGQSA